MRNIPFGKPILDEKEKQSVLEVLDGPILVHGPKAKLFEKDFANFTGAKYAVSVSSCTAAMHLSFFHLGIKPGDEVIVPAQTHTATAHAVEFCGAKPVFVDSEMNTGNIDLNQVESTITERTRAIAIVHYLGMPVDMETINALAQKYNLFVIEDCALAIGTKLNNVHAGLHGNVGCFSFYPVKHMTTAEGGMLLTQDENVAMMINRTKAFGIDRTVNERKVPGMYDVISLGYNYRMNEIQAVIGIEQLKKMDFFLKQRKNNYEILQKGLSELGEIELFQSSYDNYQSSYYCFSILLKKTISKQRYLIMDKLKMAGIGTSIYYPKPVPKMQYYEQKYSYSKENFPIASDISERTIALPVGPHLNTDDMIYIINQFKKIIREERKK